MAHVPAIPVSLSLPTQKPFRLVIDVTPVFGTALYPMGSKSVPVRTGMERLDIAVTVEEREEAADE